MASFCTLPVNHIDQPRFIPARAPKVKRWCCAHPSCYGRSMDSFVQACTHSPLPRSCLRTTAWIARHLSQESPSQASLITGVSWPSIETVIRQCLSAIQVQYGAQSARQSRTRTNRRHLPLRITVFVEATTAGHHVTTATQICAAAIRLEHQTYALFHYSRFRLLKKAFPSKKNCIRSSRVVEILCFFHLILLTFLILLLLRRRVFPRWQPYFITVQSW